MSDLFIEKLTEKDLKLMANYYGSDALSDLNDEIAKLIERAKYYGEPPTVEQIERVQIELKKIIENYFN